MALASRRLRTIPAMCRSSTTITDLALASLVVALCNPSNRWLRTRRCARANASAALARLRDPRCLRLTALPRLLRGALGHLVQPPIPGGALEADQQPVQVDGGQGLPAAVVGPAPH